MKTIERVETAGPDKTLKLSIPVEEPNRRYRLSITVVPDTEAQPDADWPERFIEETAGAWQGEPPNRDQPSDYEVRENFS